LLFTRRVTKDRCFALWNIFANFWVKKMAFLPQSKAKLCKHLILTLVFEIIANFFARLLSKIAENCDHNIDPRRICEKKSPKMKPNPFFVKTKK
jgi:hypothetical protein